MFIANKWCTVGRPAGRNLYGEDIDGTSFKERCTIVEILSKAALTNQRAQMAGSMAHAEDLSIAAKLKFTAKTAVLMGDKVTVKVKLDEIELRVMSVTPKFTTMGELDHFDVECAPWV